MLSIRRIFSPLLAACVAASVACDGPTRPNALTEIRLAAETYTRSSQGAAVRYTVANVATTTVRITNRCGDHLAPVVEERSGNKWQLYMGGTCIAILSMSPVPLDAGAQRHEIVMISEAGQYRLILGTDH